MLRTSFRVTPTGIAEFIVGKVFPFLTGKGRKVLPITSSSLSTGFIQVSPTVVLFNLYSHRAWAFMLLDQSRTHLILDTYTVDARFWNKHSKKTSGLGIWSIFIKVSWPVSMTSTQVIIKRMVANCSYNENVDLRPRITYHFYFFPTEMTWTLSLCHSGSDFLRCNWLFLLFWLLLNCKDYNTNA